MHQHAHHHIKISVISIIVLTVFINILMWGVDLVFAQKIGFGVQVSGIDLTGKTGLQAKEILEQKFWQVSSSGVGLSFQENEFNPTLDQIGVLFDTADLANQAVNYNKGGNFISRFWNTSKILFFGKNIKIKPEVDKAKLYSYLEYVGKDSVQQPQNATLLYNENNSSSYFEIVQEKIGKTIDVDKASNKINKQIQEKTDILHQDIKTVELKTSESKPTVTSNDLSDIKHEADQLIAKPFVFNYENQEFIARSIDIAKWLKFIEVNKEIQIEVNELAVNEYLDIIGEQINIPVTDRVVEFSGSKKTIKREGRDGRQLKRKPVIEKIHETFFENLDRKITLEVTTIKLTEKIVYPDSPPTGGMFPGNYIEINISAKQKMHLWKGDKLTATYTISSGKPGYYTPTGTYYVINKNIRAWSSTYGLYMPYWMGFGGGYGIHELPEWPGGYKEGLNHLGLRVSHGCVRLGVGAAAAVYSFSPIGTPIYIHY